MANKRSEKSQTSRLGPLRYVKRVNNVKKANQPQQGIIIGSTHRSATDLWLVYFGFGWKMSLRPAQTVGLPTRSSRHRACGVPQRPEAAYSPNPNPHPIMSQITHTTFLLPALTRRLHTIIIIITGWRKIMFSLRNIHYYTGTIFL